MQILFLDSIERETFGGMEEWIRLTASGLAQRGHFVTVAGRADSALFERIERTDRNVHLMPLRISGDFDPFTIGTLRRYLQRNEIDAIVVNFNKDVRLGGLAAKLSDHVRVIWSVGLDITRDGLVHRWLTPRLVHGVIVPSQSLKEQITKLGYIDPAVVHVIPIGIPDEAPEVDNGSARRRLKEKYGLQPDAIVAVTVARLVEQKGHRYLIEAASLLKTRIPRLQFLLCGSGPLDAELRKMAIDNGVADRILLAGMLSDLRDELCGADLMIHPSVEEPFGIAVLEGMRSGLPIVASRVGGIPEVLGADYVGLVHSGNAAELADTVKALLGDSISGNEIGSRLRERFLRHFTIGDMLSGVEAYLQTEIRTERQRG